MALSDKDRKQLMGLLIAVPLLLLGGYWFVLRPDTQDEIATLQTRVDSLQRAVDSARADLASGTVESLRRRVAEFESSLGIMRRLVPTDAEVANLLDDISNRAKLRNIHLADISPAGVEDGGRYRIARYRLQVLGHYDDVGAFLSDIASLPRIMVPHQIGIDAATQQQANALGDTTGSLLSVTFQLRTFVKQPALAGEGTSDR